MRWADVYVCMLADGVALRNRCPQGQADSRAAIAGGASGVTMAMARRDSPQLRLGRLCRHAIKELPGLHLPSPQVLSQDRRLRVVRKFFDADYLARAAEPQLT